MLVVDQTHWTGAELGRIITVRSSGKASGVQLSTFAQLPNVDQALPSEISTLTTDVPKSMRLITQSSAEGECEESVLRVQGVLCQVQMPPIRADAPLPDKGEARFMKQSIRLTGLGTEHFKSAIDGLANVAIFMGESLERGDIESWTPARYRCWQAIEVSNRYFVHQNSEGDMISVPLTADVDPDGVLAKAAGDDWVHAEDNRVGYFRCAEKNGKNKYTPIKPGEFKIGDLVEVQLSVIAVKRRVRGDVYSMKLVLRAITMLNDGYTRAARTSRMQQAASVPTSPSRGVKRTVGYMHDEEADDGDVPTSKMTKLTVSDEVMMGGSD
ncbi:hypothetical protein HWV62_4623 [Athelia sp. TMB]|nr:hypothetical protein HWV62_4623 [Athelia sp. TMB]